MSECLSLKYYPVQVAGPVISSKQMILMDLAWCGVVQTGPLSLVEECRGCALIGQELHSDAGASSLMP